MLHQKYKKFIWGSLGKEGANRRSFRRTVAIVLAAVLGLSIAPVLGASVASADSRLVAHFIAVNSSVYSGDRLTYEVQLSCSIPADCGTVTIHLTKPPGASGPGTVAAPYPSGVSNVVEHADGTVDFEFTATQPGQSFGMDISWPTVQFTTPSGDQPVTMTAVDQDATTIANETATIALLADATPFISKGGPATTQPDENYTYVLEYGTTGADQAGNHGGLNFLDTTVIDTLPAEAEFVSCTRSCSYDPGTHTVTWERGTFQGGSETTTLTVRFPASAVGQTLVNNVVITGTPLGQADPKSADASASVTVSDDEPVFNLSFTKSASGAAIDGAPLQWALTATNRSDVAADLTFRDTVPAGFDLTEVNGGYYNILPAGSTVEFIYDGGASSGPLPFTGAVSVPNGMPRVVSVVIILKGISVGQTVSPTLTGIVNLSGAPGAELENCATAEIEVGAIVQNSCASVETSAVSVPKPQLGKSTVSGPVAPGGTVTFAISLDNASSDAVFQPDVYDLIPNELTYVPGSFRLAAESDAVKCPAGDQFDEEITEGFTAGVPAGDVTRTMVHWRANASSAGISYIPLSAPCIYRYDTTVNPGTPSGVHGGDTSAASYKGNLVYAFDRDVRIPRGPYSFVTDTADVNGNGDTTEEAQRAGAQYTVATASALWSEKLVRGDRDADDEWFESAEKPGLEDQHGTSTPGGYVDYSVTLGNYGNRDLYSLVAYDLLPYPDNHGVTSGRYSDLPLGEGNTWVPSMTGPIDTGGAPVTITYSTNPDPCRPEMDNTIDHSAPFYCGGAQDSSFVAAGSVTDWSQIRSIRFDFGSATLVGGQKYTFTWRMDAPTTLANGDPITGGERTWNKIAAQAIQGDNGVPLLAAEAPWVVDQMYVPAGSATPGISLVKNYTVVDDTNGNGINDAGDIIKWTFLVTNTGDTTLNNITVNDPLLDQLGIAITCDPNTLTAGASVTCESQNYTITDADVEAGEIHNIATATGEVPPGTPGNPGNPTSPPDEVTVPLEPKQGELEFKKIAHLNDANGNKKADAGETIDYSFLLTNIGGAKLTGVQVDDPFLTQVGIGVSCPKNVLMPGEQMTCTADKPYTVTDADVARGEVHNVATASGTTVPNVEPLIPPTDQVTTPTGPKPSGLALTGTNVALAFGIALVLLSVGGVIMLVRRRREGLSQ